jgi:galactokinase
MALLLLKLHGSELAPMKIAKLCQRAEHKFAGVESGLLDQVTVIFGRANHAVYFDALSEEVRTVPFPADLALVIADSGKRRSLSDGRYNLRREECHAAAKALGVTALRDASTETVLRSNLLTPLRERALHVVGENERVLRALDCLRSGDSVGVGALMSESHESSRKNFANSTPELDLLVDLARNLPGVLGARLTGAGFGGATVTLCRQEDARSVAEKLSIEYRTRTNLSPHAFVCHIADGAR